MDGEPQLFDRGLISTNQVMDIWQMAQVPGGDKRWIRKEYAEVSEVGKVEETEVNQNANGTES